MTNSVTDVVDAERLVQVDSPAGLLTLRVPGAGDLVGDRIAAEGRWEPLESRVAVALTQGGVVLDAGAHLGYFTALVLTADPDARVIAVEPAPAQLALLRANTNEFGARARVVAGALVGLPGTRQLRDGGSNSGDCHLPGEPGAAAARAGDTVAGVAGVAVECIIGDDFGLAAPDLIKLDVQGAEVAALAGLAATLERGRHHTALLVEFWPQGLARFGSDASALIERLAAHERVLLELDPTGERLIRITPEQLRDKTERWLTPGSGGFINLVALPTGRLPALARAGLAVVDLATALAPASRARCGP